MIDFPDPRDSSPEGLVAVGGRLDAETLKAAYARGIFPWPQPGYPMIWFSPDPRGILDFADLHIPRSLERTRRRRDGEWRLTVNAAFEQVMRECQAKTRPGQDGTWIVPEMLPSYRELHQQGQALSVECWQGDELIGGIYGVLSEHYFSGESMFYHQADASKLAFLHLIEELQRRGLTWMDVQMVTPVVERLGGRYIAREDFLKRIGI